MIPYSSGFAESWGKERWKGNQSTHLAALLHSFPPNSLRINPSSPFLWSLPSLNNTWETSGTDQQSRYPFLPDPQFSRPPPSFHPEWFHVCSHVTEKTLVTQAPRLMSISSWAHKKWTTYNYSFSCRSCQPGVMATLSLSLLFIFFTAANISPCMAFACFLPAVKDQSYISSGKKLWTEGEWENTLDNRRPLQQRFWSPATSSSRGSDQSSEWGECERINCL